MTERVEASGEVRDAARRGGGHARPCRRCSPQAARSLVIHFLHSYANPAHERRAAEIAARALAERLHHRRAFAAVESREFERGVTASVNASVQPILRALCPALRATSSRARGYERDFLIMNGNGGMISAASSRESRARR